MFSEWLNTTLLRWSYSALMPTLNLNGFEGGISPVAQWFVVPPLWSDGTGAEVMQRIAAPMIGDMITAPLLSMLVIPAAYYLMRRGRISSSARRTS